MAPNLRCHLSSDHAPEASHRSPTAFKTPCQLPCQGKSPLKTFACLPHELMAPHSVCKCKFWVLPSTFQKRQWLNVAHHHSVWAGKIALQLSTIFPLEGQGDFEPRRKAQEMHRLSLGKAETRQQLADWWDSFDTRYMRPVFSRPDNDSPLAASAGLP